MEFGIVCGGGEGGKRKEFTGQSRKEGREAIRVEVNWRRDSELDTSFGPLGMSWAAAHTWNLEARQ